MWSATHRAKAICLWLFVIVLATAVGGVLAPRQATDAELTVGEAQVSAQLAKDAGYAPPVVENVLITSGSRAERTRAAQLARTELASTAGVGDVSAALPSGDGQSLLVQVMMEGDPDTATERVAPLQSAVAGVAERVPSVRVEQVGPASIGLDFDEWLARDLQKATVLSLPVTLVILLIVFGALVMAAIPVALALSSVAAGLGLWSLASQVVPDPGTTMHLIVLVGMAVGVDYSLFYLRRYREERHSGADDLGAIRVAAETAGHSVLVSGLAVALSMAGLFIAGDTFSTAMATRAIIVVLVALLSSVTVLPAMLSSLGRFVDRPRVPVLWRLTSGNRGPRLVPALIGGVLRRPRVSLLLCVAVLGALTLPVLQLSLKSTQLEDFPRDLPTMQSYDRLLAAYPDSSGTDLVVARIPEGAAAPAGSSPGRTAPFDAPLAQLRRGVEASPSLFGDVGEPWFSADGRTVVVPVTVPHPVTSAEARSALDRLRVSVVPAAFGSVAGAEFAVGGDAAANLDYTDLLRQRLPWVVGAVLLLVFGVMVFAYRSVAIGLITVALNALSVGATFGVLVLLFQGTWAQGLLGFTSNGHVVAWVPLLLFVVLSGLSLDYHVFVVSRIRENSLAGLDARAAIRDGIVRTAGVVTSAAVVMVAVFSIFGMLSFVELKQVGVGLAVGVVIDATIIRIVALPALMLLCRRVLWWRGQ